MNKNNNQAQSIEDIDQMVCSTKKAKTQDGAPILGDVDGIEEDHERFWPLHEKPPFKDTVMGHDYNPQCFYNNDVFLEKEQEQELVLDKGEEEEDDDCPTITFSLKEKRCIKQP